MDLIIFPITQINMKTCSHLIWKSNCSATNNIYDRLSQILLFFDLKTNSFWELLLTSVFNMNSKTDMIFVTNLDILHICRRSKTYSWTQPKLCIHSYSVSHLVKLETRVYNVQILSIQSPNSVFINQCAVTSFQVCRQFFVLNWPSSIA